MKIEAGNKSLRARKLEDSGHLQTHGNAYPTRISEGAGIGTQWLEGEERRGTMKQASGVQKA